MFAAIREMIITFCSFFTSLFTAANNGSKSLEALSEYALQESQLVRDRGKIKNSVELKEVAKSLESI